MKKSVFDEWKSGYGIWDDDEEVWRLGSLLEARMFRAGYVAALRRVHLLTSLEEKTVRIWGYAKNNWVK